jgi:hypothetical protein
MNSLNQYQNFVSGVNRYWQQFPRYGGYSGNGGYRSSGGSGGGPTSGYAGSGGSDPKQLVVTDPGPKP